MYANSTQTTQNTETRVHKITNVPVFLNGTWILMILMRKNTFQGQLEGVGPENQDFFGP